MRPLILLLLIFSLSGLAGELRGVWIHSPFGIKGWDWDRSVKVLADNGFNALFANFAWAGCADYPSKVLATHPSLISQDGAVRDPLQECLDACNKYGIDLHVWIVACNLGHRTPAAVKEEFQKAGRTQLKLDGTASEYLMPHLPENIELLKDTVTEIAERYPVAGIHLDYIRYPDGQHDFSESAKKAFAEWAELDPESLNWPADCLEKGAQREAFLTWRRNNITELVRQSYQALKAVRPQCALSAAVYGWWPGAKLGIAQDAAAWAQEGMVDFLCPMNYSGDSWEAGAWLRQQLKVLNGAVPVYTGLANYMCNDYEALANQIADSRRFGADGFICFQLNEKFANERLPIVKKELASETAAPPFAHQEPRLKSTWRHRAARWRLIPRWTIGDRYQCVIKGCDSKTEPAVTLLRNGIPDDANTVEEISLSGDELILAFRAKKPGFYRWKIEWIDEHGTAHAALSTARYVKDW